MIDFFSKAKAAKLLRELVDSFLDMKHEATGKEVSLCVCGPFTIPDPSMCAQVSLCQDCIEWAKKENRMFLRQALQARLVALYVDLEKYNKGLEIATVLLKELKKIDDKALLVEVCQWAWHCWLLIVMLPCGLVQWNL